MVSFRLGSVSCSGCPSSGTIRNSTWALTESEEMCVGMVGTVWGLGFMV